MTPEKMNIAIPQSAVAAAGRAMQFYIADLSASLRRGDHTAVSSRLLEAEIMDMMDANKAMFSALPIINRETGKGAAPCARGWHRMASAPRGWKVIFWIVPKPPEECCADDGTPIISWNTPRFLFCEYGCWPSVDKAIAWMEPPSPPAPAAYP